MANYSLNDLSLSQQYFKLPLDLYDRLYDSLNQAAALICVANCEDFLDFDKTIARNYLFILQNLILDALESYQQLDDSLIKQSS